MTAELSRLRTVVFAASIALVLAHSSVGLANGPLSETKLLADDGVVWDFFGFSVAYDGDTVVVGAPSLCCISDLGSAYVYVRNGSTWMLQAKLVPDDLKRNQRFGVSVGISGNTVVVGAENDAPEPELVEAGSAYVFVRTGNTWTQQQKLIPGVRQNFARFGNAVAISGDSVVIAAKADDADLFWGPSNSGSVYVFDRIGASWIEVQKLVASDKRGALEFGESVAIEDGTMVVGAVAGSAYVFERSASTWGQTQRMEGSGHFGASADLNGDTILVGAELHGTGVVHVFRRSGSAWPLEQVLVPSDGQAGDRFGVSAAISGDTVVVGASRADAAYLFARSGNTWTQERNLTPSDGDAGDRFGISVDTDGETVVVGAFRDDDNGEDAGSAYVYSPGAPADTMPPVVTVPEDVTDQVATSPSGATVFYPPATATDNVGVVSGPTCTPPSGSTFPIGSTTVICTASDAAGNVGSTSFTVTVTSVAEALEGLATNVSTLGLPNGVSNALLSKLTAAIELSLRGQDRTGVNQLTAFVRHVDAQRGKKIGESEAAGLIAIAERIIAALDTE